MDNKDQQKDEIDLLMNIVPDKLEIEQDDPNYILKIKIIGSVDEPKMQFELKITLQDDYPTIEPEIELYETNNFIAGTKLEKMRENLSDICKEYIGMPVVYQLYEAVQTFADEEEQIIINEQIKLEKEEEEEQKRIEEKLRKEEEELLQQQTYTPVTKELFDEWYINFIKEQNSKKIIKESDKRPSGREFFLNKKLNLEVEDVKEGEIAAEKVEEGEQVDEQFEAEIFEEDINDIDFDNDDNLEDL